MAQAKYTAEHSRESGLPVVTRADRRRLLTDLLKGVSRAFYLTLRVLPHGLREPIGIAYLLARAADTITDTRLLPPDDRLSRLLAFREQVRGPASMEALRNIGVSLQDKQTIADERTLLEALPQAFALLESLGDADREQVRSIVVTLTRGMEIDLTKFPAEDSGNIGAMDDFDELDSYVYYVAGCVGEFWTSVTMSHTSSLKDWDGERMSEIGVRFGKALQLTNVLRDVPNDLRIGRCYLPANELATLGLSPTDLLDVSVGSKARPVLVEGINQALEHYEYAERYLIAIPRRGVRLRLAVMWPILIGLGTLAVLARNEAWLDPDQPSKVGRRWVYRMMAQSLLGGHSNSVMRRWIANLRKQVVEAL